jgi:preprotein translocase subunit SecG
MGFLIFLHVVICILLGIIILMQSGRGGGLAEGFASAESMFGAKTNVFLVRTTTVLGVFFLVTCLSLAFLSSKKEKSLMPQTISIPIDTGSDDKAPQEP